MVLKITKPLTLAVLSLTGALAMAQPKPPDAGQILEQTREPLRLPPPSEPSVTPRPPEPKPALPVQPQLKVNVTRFVFTGNTIYPEAELQAVVQEFVGKQLDFDGLNQAATKVRAYYRERGYFLAQAYLPQQAIRNGTVEIAIIEGRVGVLELDRKPASRLSERLLAGIVGAHLKEGEVITETGLERPLLLINDLPTAQVTSEIRPSRTVGAADLRVNVDSSAGLVNGYVDFDNHGNRFTGEYRIGANLNVNNPLGQGDLVTLRGVMTDEQMWLTRLAYLIPVWYYGSRLGVSLTAFDYELAKDFKNLQAHGRGQVASVFGFHPFLRTRNANLILQLAYEDKKLLDRVDTTGTLEDRYIKTGKIGFVGDFRDILLTGGLNSYGLTVTAGDLDIEPAAVAAADVAAGTGRSTQGNFSKVNGEIRRLQRAAENWSVLLAFSGQKASKNLASAEKFSLGGPNGVRAYPVGEATADSGLLFTGEVRYLLPGFKIFEGDLTLSGFYDYGYAKLFQKPLPTDTQNKRKLSGYGVGLGVGREGNFIMQASAAWQAGDEDPQSDTAKRVPRVWLQAIKWF